MISLITLLTFTINLIAANLAAIPNPHNIGMDGE